MIKLFYIAYDYKMSLGAMRDYTAATNRCLWRDLLAVVEAWENSSAAISSDNAMQIASHRIGAICDAVPFNDAAHLFKALIDAAGSRVSIDDIDDGMFRSGLIPSDRPDNCGEPWPLVLVKVAQDINKGMIADVKKKPQAGTGQDQISLQQISVSTFGRGGKR